MVRSSHSQHSDSPAATGSLLAAGIDEILQTWQHKVQQTLSNGSQNQTGPTQLPEMRTLLSCISQSLQDRQGYRKNIESIARSLLTAHLSHTDFSLQALLQEYAVLRDSIFSQLEQESPLPPATRDIICSCVDLAMVHSAAAYEQQHTAVQEPADNLRQTHEAIRTGLEAIPVVIYEQDLDLRYTWAIPGDFCLSAAELIGKQTKDFLEANDAQQVDDLKRQAISSGQQVKGEVTILLKGEKVNLALSVMPLRNPAGQITGVVGSSLRITDYQHALATAQSHKEQIEFILATSGIGFWIWDLKNKTSYLSPTGKAQIGFTDHELDNHFSSWEERIHPDDLERVRGLVQDVIRQHRSCFEVEYRVRHKNGSWRHMLARGSWTPTAENPDHLLMGVHIDITKRKQTEDALIREKELAQTTLKAIGEGVITTDSDGRIEQMNHAAECLTGWEETEAKGRPLAEVLHLIDERDRRPLPCPASSTDTDSSQREQQANALLLDRKGNECPVSSIWSPIHDSRRAVVGAVIILHDASEERRILREMARHALYDSLTGLVNRREFERRLNRTIHDVSSGTQPAALLYLDLDRFKIVNDTCGHAAGDELLQQLTDLFRSHVRDRDTLARIGGDEFAIILEHCTVEQAMRVANALREAVQQYRFNYEDKVFQIGVSIGLVPIDHHPRSLEQVLELADQACYLAKSEGRNQVRMVQNRDWILSAGKEELSWITRLKDALVNDHLKLFLQPIVPLNDSLNPGERYEVLLRMRDGNSPWISPGAFLPAAERYDLMPRIDCWVVERILQWLSQQPDATANISFCAINLSARTISERNSQQHLLSLLKNHPLPPNKLCFEISEAEATRNLSRLDRFIRDLQAAGYLIALDHFGTGVTSFANLRQMPVDILKIDSSFTATLSHHPETRAIVKSINEIGHLLGKQTIASHVSNETMMNQLRKLGVDYAQGYHIATPRELETG